MSLIHEFLVLLAVTSLDSFGTFCPSFVCLLFTPSFGSDMVSLISCHLLCDCSTKLQVLKT